MAASGSETALGEYVGLLRRRWRVVLMVLLACVLLGVTALYLMPAQYESSTAVLVQPTADDSTFADERTNSEINLDTEAQLVTSSVVARRSARLMENPKPSRELASQVSVAVPANTSILGITFTASTPATAQAGAAAFAQGYLENRKAVAEEAAQTRAASLQTRIKDINKELRAVGEQLDAALPGSAQTDYLRTQQSLLVQQLRARTAERSTLTEKEVTPGTVITEADKPLAPTRISPALVLSSSVFLGLLLGVIAASLRDRTDRRVRSRRELEGYGLDVLVSRVTLPTPDHFDEKFFRQCRNALLAGLPGHRGSFVVTSISADLSGSTVAAGLATTFANSGAKTALVCCNTQSHVIEDTFGVYEGLTLTDVLRSRATAGKALQPVGRVPNLSVVLPGRDGIRLSGLLQSASLHRVLTELERLAEVVVLDVPPAVTTADAQTVVTATQGALLVATAGMTTPEEVAEVVSQMTKVNASVLGAVLVDPSRPRKHSTRRGGKRRPPRMRQEKPTEQHVAPGSGASRHAVPPGHNGKGSENPADSSVRQ